MGWCIWFFQFMPSTMLNYAIDYDKNGSINLKSNIDAYASAANYLKQIGWKSNEPCFYRINLSNNCLLYTSDAADE